MPTGKSDEDVFQRRRVRAEFGEVAPLSGDFRKDRRHRAVQLGDLNLNATCLLLHGPDAIHVRQRRRVNRRPPIRRRGELDGVGASSFARQFALGRGRQCGHQRQHNQS